MILMIADHLVEVTVIAEVTVTEAAAVSTAIPRPTLLQSAPVAEDAVTVEITERTGLGDIMRKTMSCSIILDDILLQPFQTHLVVRIRMYERVLASVSSK